MRKKETTSLPIAAGALPVTVDEAKAHARVELSDDDTLIQALIDTVTALAEEYTGRRYVDRSYEIYYDACDFTKQAITFEVFDSGISSTVFTYFDADGSEAAVDTDIYEILGNRIILGLDIRFLEVRKYDSYKLTYDIAHAPWFEHVKQAIKMGVAHLYEQREAVAIQDGFTLKDLPMSVIALLQRDKIWTA
jgi:hypothetical protein